MPTYNRLFAHKDEHRDTLYSHLPSFSPDCSYSANKEYKKDYSKIIPYLDHSSTKHIKPTSRLK